MSDPYEFVSGIVSIESKVTESEGGQLSLGYRGIKCLKNIFT